MYLQHRQVHLSHITQAAQRAWQMAAMAAPQGSPTHTPDTVLEVARGAHNQTSLSEAMQCHLACHKNPAATACWQSSAL